MAKVSPFSDQRDLRQLGPISLLKLPARPRVGRRWVDKPTARDCQPLSHTRGPSSEFLSRGGAS